MSEIPSSGRDPRSVVLGWVIGVFIVVVAGVALGLGMELADSLLISGIAGVGLFVVYVVGYIVLFVVFAPRFNAENMAAMAMLGRGEHAKAATVWTGWSANKARPMAIRALAKHNLGWTVLRQGEPQRAIALLAENDRDNRRCLKASRIDGTSAVDLSLAHGLIGDLDAGQIWLAEAEKRSTATNPITFDTMLAFARAVLDCRSGRAADAARTLAERWSEYESVAPGDVVRPLRILRAFAMAQSGPRDAGLVESMISNSRPAYPGEYDFLGVKWPEMASFLTAHELARRS